MIIKSEKCLFAHIECEHASSCKYLSERFGVFDCEPVKYKRLLINLKHQQELKERRKILDKLQNDKKV